MYSCIFYKDMIYHLTKLVSGSASLAQVHRAVLRSSNREVAVKVQHSTVQEHSKIDTIVIEVDTSRTIMLRFMLINSSFENAFFIPITLFRIQSSLYYSFLPKHWTKSFLNLSSIG